MNQRDERAGSDIRGLLSEAIARSASGLVRFAAASGRPDGEILELVKAVLLSGAHEARVDAAALGAARLFAAAEAFREVIGAPRPPSEQEDHRRTLRRVRKMLDEEAFAAAWEEGRAMSLDEAVTYALSEP